MPRPLSRWSIAACLLSAGLLLCSLPLPAAADSAADQLQQLQQQEAGKRATLAQLAKDQAAAQAALASLRAGLAAKTADLAAIQLQAQALSQEIQLETTQEQQLTAEHDRHVVMYSGQVRGMYKTGPIGTLVFLFGASSFSDLLDRFLTMTHIVRSVQDRAHQLGVERDKLDQERSRTTQLQAALTPLLDELAQQQATAQAAYNSQASLVTSIEAGQRAALGGLLTIQRRERQLEAALAAAEAAAAAAARKGAGISYAATCPAPPAGTIIFCGHGWGHGVGMSQYGAYGMAKQGSSWQQILAHFYTGATLGPVPEPLTVRVLLTAAGASLTPQGAATLKDDQDVVLATVAAGHAVQFSRQSSGQVSATGGSVPVTAKTIRLVPAASTFVASASGRHYRGEAWVDGSPGRLEVVNHLDVEDYLRGLGEVPSSWPLGAIQAQVTAARTYVVAHLGSGSFDVDDTTSYQVYLGSDRETASQDQAVATTKGTGIIFNGSLIDAVYSSSDGGHSECASATWGNGADGAKCAPAYLQGVIDNFDLSPLHTWYSKPHSLADYQRYLGPVYDSAACGNLLGFDLSQRDDSGRVKSVRLLGSASTCTVTVSIFKNRLNSTSAPADVAFYSDLFGATPGRSAWPYW